MRGEGNLATSEEPQIALADSFEGNQAGADLSRVHMKPAEILGKARFFV